MLTLCRWHHQKKPPLPTIPCHYGTNWSCNCGRGSFPIFCANYKPNRVWINVTLRLSSIIPTKSHLASPSCYLSPVSNCIQTGQTATWIAILDLPWGRSRCKLFLAWKTVGGNRTDFPQTNALRNEHLFLFKGKSRMLENLDKLQDLNF